MPAPSRTGREQIVDAATALLEDAGTEGVTMQAVAQRVGVRPPSLYKHVRHRRELLDAVVAASVDALTERLAAARVEGDPRRSITAQVDELRRFAHGRPRAYGLVMGTAPDVHRPTPEVMRVSLRLLLDATTALAGEAHALDAARLVVAWANGFISMELADALRMGGDVDAAWSWGLDRVVAAVADRSAG